MGSSWRRVLALAILLPVWALSFLMPRKRDLWALGTWDGFTYTGNTRYLHAWLHANEKGRITAVWITRDLELARELRNLGAAAESLYSARGIWTCLRAGNYIFTHTVDDINLWLSGRARLINLWHGVPLKKINYDNRFDRYRHVYGLRGVGNWPNRFKRILGPHRIVVPSESQREVFASAFRIASEKILPAGYPRNDRLVDSDFPDLLLPSESECLERIRRLRAGGRRIILYMPTFRRCEKPGQYREALKVEELDSKLKALNGHMLIKAHPMSTDLASFAENGFDRIGSIPSSIDPYLLLPLTDMLLTDYSSIFYDYLLLDRPIVFYPFDFEHYQQMERELYFDYEQHVPGPIARKPEELFDLLEILNRDDDGYQARRRRLLAEVFNENRGDSCSRIVAATAGAPRKGISQNA